MNNSKVNKIHETAEIHPSATLGHSNIFSQGVIIGAGVEIGSGNFFGPYSIIGATPEIKSSPRLETETINRSTNSNSKPRTIIGSGNVFREFVTVSAGHHATTRILDDIYAMRNSHIGHDAQVGSDVVLSSNSVLGGHSIVFPYANIGLGSTVHQRSIVGIGSMIGMLTAVRRFTGHFATVNGNPATKIGNNKKIIDALGLHQDLVIKIQNSIWELPLDEINGNDELIEKLKSFICEVQIS